MACKLEPTDDSFDDELLPLINSKLSILSQIGPNGIRVTGVSETWDQVIIDPSLDMVREYIGTSVRLVFDPPQSGGVLKALQDMAKELEWRIDAAVTALRK